MTFHPQMLQRVLPKNKSILLNYHHTVIILVGNLAGTQDRYLVASPYLNGLSSVFYRFSFSFCIQDPVKCHTFIQKSLLSQESSVALVSVILMILIFVKTLATSFAGSPLICNCLIVFLFNLFGKKNCTDAVCPSYWHYINRLGGQLVPLIAMLNNSGHLFGLLIKITFPLPITDVPVEYPLGSLTKCEASTLFPIIFYAVVSACIGDS